ncbi:hypothetical protein LOY54_17645 [Pseudomonas sp. B21-032]|uniref:hypothetical protein n=1 Tax=Pseudomonas sp. B21-032 TaxID=2895483 RepID=UPI00215E3ACC|nr:hypothetical protein [Pseudomonas sp. B21-032]UVL59863.1 hypothetical protein LOY54_17645 [Pseudomonas sp. B21-032]
MIKNKFHVFLLGAGGVALSLIVLVASMYVNYFSAHIVVDQEKWGQFGDYFGGVLNPVLSFMAFVAVLYNVKFGVGAEERSEIRHREQLAEQRLFQLLSLMGNAVERSAIVVSGATVSEFETHVGLQAQHSAASDLRMILSTAARKAQDLQCVEVYGELRMEFRSWRRRCWGGVGQYLDSAFLVLDYIMRGSTLPPDFKRFALNALRVQMTESERLSLWYSALFSAEYSHFLEPMLDAGFVDDPHGSLNDFIKPWRGELMAAAMGAPSGQN